MALKWLRDNLRHLKFVLWGVVAVFVLLVFVDWGAGRSGPAGGAGAAVRVGDREISEQEFIAELRRLNDLYSRRFGEHWTELRDQVDLPAQTVAFFITRELQLAEAEDAGIVVSEDELKERILSDPMFQREGGGFVGAERYERIVRSAFQMSPVQFERRYAEDLVLGKLNSMLTSGVWVSDDEAMTTLRRERDRADLKAVQLRYEPFLAAVEPTAEEVRAHYHEHAEEYRRSEQRVIRYLLVETSRLRRLLPVDDSELERFYDEHRTDFVEAKQAHARHILFRVSPGAPASERAEVKLRADSVAAIARGGADFSELAAKHSEDPGSRDNGGDLGWFGPGQMVKEFEDAVFAGKPGDIIGPVESQYGYHIIRVEGFKPQRQRPFEEVREQVRFRYLEGRAAAEAEVRASELARRIASEKPETQEAWQSIADEDESVVLNVSPPFEHDEPVPGTGGGTELTDDVFNAKAGAIGGPRPIARGWMVWQLEQIRPAGVAPFDDVRGEVEQQVRRLRALDAATVRARELAEKWRVGASAETVAAEFGGQVLEAADHRWGGQITGLGGAVVLDEAVFGASEGAVVGPLSLGDRGVLVARVERLQLIGADEIEAERPAVRQRLQDERAQRLLQSILAERRRNTQVTVNDDLMERFAPSS